MNSDLDKHLIAYEGRTQYDFDNDIMLKWYPQRIIKYTKKTDSVLELGLGHGFSVDIFSQYFKRHVVLEGSSAIIDNFKSRFPNCQAQIIKTYFEDYVSHKKFDVIVMGFILEHVDKPFDIIRRYKKYLKTRGKMFMTVPNAEALNRRLGYLAGILPEMHILSENDINLGHKRYYTVGSLKDEVKKSGLKIERIEGLFLKPFTTQQLISLNLDKKIIGALCEVGVNYPELTCGILVQLKGIK